MRSDALGKRGGKAIIPGLKEPKKEFNTLESVFEQLLEHEILVTKNINNVVDTCLKEKDYTTHNFMQWYVSEQLEEEALARVMLDKIKLIKGDSAGIYLFDRDLENSAITIEGDTEE